METLWLSSSVDALFSDQEPDGNVLSFSQVLNDPFALSQTVEIQNEPEIEELNDHRALNQIVEMQNVSEIEELNEHCALNQTVEMQNVSEIEELNEHRALNQTVEMENESGIDEWGDILNILVGELPTLNSQERPMTPVLIESYLSPTGTSGNYLDGDLSVSTQERPTTSNMTQFSQVLENVIKPTELVDGENSTSSREEEEEEEEEEEKEARTPELEDCSENWEIEWLKKVYKALNAIAEYEKTRTEENKVIMKKALECLAMYLSVGETELKDNRKGSLSGEFKPKQIVEGKDIYFVCPVKGCEQQFREKVNEQDKRKGYYKDVSSSCKKHITNKHHSIICRACDSPDILIKKVVGYRFKKNSKDLKEQEKQSGRSDTQFWVGPLLSISRKMASNPNKLSGMKAFQDHLLHIHFDKPHLKAVVSPQKKEKVNEQKEKEVTHNSNTSRKRKNVSGQSEQRSFKKKTRT